MHTGNAGAIIGAEELFEDTSGFLDGVGVGKVGGVFLRGANFEDFFEFTLGGFDVFEGFKESAAGDRFNWVGETVAVESEVIFELLVAVGEIA